MDALRELSPHLENPWIQSLGIFILSLALTVVLRWSLRLILFALVQKTKTELDDIVIRSVKSVATYAIPVIGLMVALTPLALTTSVPQRTLFSVLAVLVMRGAIKLAEDLFEWAGNTWVKRTDSTLDDGLLPLLRRVVKTTIVILGVLVILGKWEIQIGPLLGALGIGGLAIGLALNSSLANIFGGIQLILDRSLNVGDQAREWGSRRRAGRGPAQHQDADLRQRSHLPSQFPASQCAGHELHQTRCHDPGHREFLGGLRQ